MALITPGPLAGQISGRIGPSVFSHNRGGPYVRNGTIPITVTSTAALAQKARVTAASQAWRNLTDNQRQAWTDWAQTNPVFNRLGSQVTLQGNAAYVRLNTRILATGGSQISVPPVTQQPGALETGSLSLDIGPGQFEITYTPSPLAANVFLVLDCAVVNSAGISYVTNLLKQVSVVGPAQASPYDFQSDLEARFGTLSVGQKVIVFARTVDQTSGLSSRPQRLEGLIVDTTP